MLIRTASHLYAETIAEGDFRAEWEQLVTVLGTIDPPLRPPGLSRALAVHPPLSANTERSGDAGVTPCFLSTKRLSTP